jgi:hypothetical protein
MILYFENQKIRTSFRQRNKLGRHNGSLSGSILESSPVDEESLEAVQASWAGKLTRY